MKKLSYSILFAIGILCGGCTSCMLIDISNCDIIKYRYAPWENKEAEEAAARARYYWYGASECYPTNIEHVLEIRLYKRGETNDVKRARYNIVGTKSE